VLVDAPAISEFFRSREAKILMHQFRRVILVSDLDWIEGAALQVQDFEGLIGIQAQKNQLSPLAAAVKRELDILGALIIGLLAAPIMVLTILWIKLDSPGPVFFSHERLGKDGRTIWIHKFRSMCENAEQALQEYLQLHPEARREWEATQKLCNDPRITRAGEFIRKFSIDELPQLYNVLKGDMSLVGARPIVDAETHHYGDNIDIYKNMRPGVTGLWQVSGRSDTSYSDRVRYDTYYVRNWSVWLDLYVLLRTVYVVLTRDGAY
jgi:Undecaprenyl-phosphate galactose phosphotransferase WbaP